MSIEGTSGKFMLIRHQEGQLHLAAGLVDPGFIDGAALYSMPAGELGALQPGKRAAYLGGQSTDGRGVVWYRISYNGEDGWVRSGRDMVLTFGYPRLIYTNGMNLIIITVIVLSLGLFAALGAFFFLADKYIIRAFCTLATDIGNVEKNGLIDPGKHDSFDEIHSVCIAINDLMERIEQGNQVQRESKSSLAVLTNILNGLDAYLYVSDSRHR